MKGIIILFLIIISDVTKGEELFKDKEIFKPGRKWTYSVSFINSKKDTVDSQKVELEVFKEMFCGQRKVKWRYYKNGNWEKGEETGVVEDSEQVFLHPPRHYDFRFTELSNFPAYYCQKTLCITKKEQEAGMVWKQIKIWTGELSIGKGWGKWENLTVKTYAKVVGKKYIRTLMKDSLECWQIDTKGESKLGIYKTTYYFHPQYGFVRWEYTKPTGEQVILDLEKVTGF
ncbi:MAG: hypothetical protein PHE49_09950 [bacterium]|nr:hypothetical protein [bacterium]